MRKSILIMLLILSFILTGCSFESVVDNTVAYPAEYVARKDNNPIEYYNDQEENAYTGTQESDDIKEQDDSSEETETNADNANDETQNESCNHEWNNGVCNVCNYENPNYDDMKEALRNSKRYVNLIDIDAQLVLNIVDQYKSFGGDEKLFEILEYVEEMNDYYSKILEYCSPLRELYPLVLECDKEIPLVTSETLSDVKLFAEKSLNVKTIYNLECESWGIVIE